jgi:hypothetical protein
MLDLFRQATETALSLLGEPSVLRGSVACLANVEHGVRITRFQESYASEADIAHATVERDIATIATTYLPRVNDSLSHPSGNYKLDSILEDRGAYRRFVLLKVA